MSASLERGQNGTLVIEIDAQGNENALGFSVNFDAAQLRFVSASLGSGASGATPNVNTNQAANGRIGIALALPTNQVFVAGTKQLLIVTFVALSNGNGGTAAVTLGDQPVAREIVDAAANSLNANWTAATVTLTRTVASVSAASYKSEALAADAIVAAFGANLATRQQAAASVPLPTTLGGTTVSVRDGAGNARNAPLFFTSPTQVNYLVPAGTAPGQATITVTSSDQTVSIGKVNIAAIAPGLFAANANGQGVPAAVALRVKADGTQISEPVARFDASQNRFVAVPLDVSNPQEQVFLVLFGTGFRNRRDLTAVSVRIGGLDGAVNFAGAQGGLVGLDQLNVLVPRALSGRGEVELVLSVDGVAANAVRVSIR